MKIKFKRITALFAALAIMITALPLTIIPISAAGTDGAHYKPRKPEGRYHHPA